MVTETPNDNHLMPDRYPQRDLFICDVADAVLKDIMQHMEHPFYSLSKKPETTVREYTHNSHWLRVTPSVKGLATIYDKDILIYAISQIMAKRKAGEEIHPRVRINSRDFLIFTKRGTGGKDYKALVEALERLRGTTISTNIRTGDEEQIDTFGLIDTSSVRRKFGLDGRLLWVDVVLSNWVFNAIEKQEVLTLHPDYFRLRKPMERRIYELARKHCGHKETWRCSVEKLHKKSGSKSPLKQFRYLLKEIAKTNHIPDYTLQYDAENDVVTFINRDTMPELPAPETDKIKLKSATYEVSKKAAPGWDIYFLEREWRAWIQGKGIPKKPDAAFIGFCRKKGALR